MADRTGPQTGLGMADWDYQTGADLIRTGQSNGMATPSPAPKLDWYSMLGTDAPGYVIVARHGR